MAHLVALHGCRILANMACDGETSARFNVTPKYRSNVIEGGRFNSELGFSLALSLAPFSQNCIFKRQASRRSHRGAGAVGTSTAASLPQIINRVANICFPFIYISCMAAPARSFVKPDGIGMAARSVFFTANCWQNIIKQMPM